MMKKINSTKKIKKKIILPPSKTIGVGNLTSERALEILRGGSIADVEEFLGFESGTFKHIPHYAEEEALGAILHVREMEEKQLFREGLYYAVLSDLCRSTEAARTLGNELSKKRVETFILTCIDALGHSEPTNYFHFLREMGDGVLIIFSSFADAYEWWQTMNSWLRGRNGMWMNELTLSKSKLNQFRLEAKTVIHAGEIAYSGTTIPLCAAVNEVFKVEKMFKAYELGITHQALACANPILQSFSLHPTLRGKKRFTKDKELMKVYLLDNYQKLCRRSRKARKDEFIVKS